MPGSERQALMREGWEVLTFGQVLAHDVRRVRVEVGRQYPIVGVLGFGRGLLYREPVSSETTGYRELNEIRPNQAVYSKLKAFEGAITVAPPDLPESYASGEFPTFTTTQRVLPEYLRLLTQQSELWRTMAAKSKGMGGRRERLSPADFLMVRAVFPPVPEQRRIVHLVDALDAAIAASSELNRARRAAAVALRSSVFATDEAVIVGEQCSVSVGKQLQTKATAGEQCAYLRAGNIADGTLDLGEIKHMRVTADELGRLRLLEGDVLVVEGGNGYGKSAKWADIGHPVVFQNHVLRLRPQSDAYDTDYLFQWARFCHESGNFKPTGTGITNLGVGNIRKMRIAKATSDRRAVISLLVHYEEAEAAARATSTALGQLRSTLLTTLLSGEHQILESYGELMEVTA